ncbi:tRNA lysidine(34) synthetase TilS [Halothiobacillus neapolitanus]|uniref:tRNA(Ile)-lysidine synthase n=1 Tax=Halothiobacillus neapolitanus (strain ATCC 23641 / DSM 15147 / CIP 104769 / NCIMB 8539 / c2) TaxID=555778 RepID=D0KZU9_HALNC|nr:tRNA lysidine(34) synthetase TilS [Halothiobacillus neapolitanus]ACX95972.1 tRNA(Ile)-lysidine synthetase [Halothiobacillus neapolitanus c2]TDN66280.1 tRNA(Ile)-lysidine synthase [Halothiobacillus neapolitanus]
MPDAPLPDSLPKPLKVVLASSGGADSLGALVWLHNQYQQGVIDEITVVSIDHQIHPDSAEWSARACQQASFFSIESHCIKIDVPTRGIHGQHSLESRARWARYEALRSWLYRRYQPEDEPVLVTAHHLEDQVETFLLAALRGSGAAGLSAMPALTRFGAGWHWRPFLQMPRDDLRQFAASLPLIPVDDPSNQDLSYDRNYLRAEILPRIQSRWPQALVSLGEAARQSGDDLALLESLAAIDGNLESLERLPLSQLLALAPSRQANVLRTWIKRHGALMPPKARLIEFLRQLKTAEPDQHPELAWGDWLISRYRDELWWRIPPDLQAPEALPWTDKTHSIEYSPGKNIHLVRTQITDPLAIGERWLDRDWLIRTRRPKDRIQPQGSAHSRSLKNWFQENACPPWVRSSIPVVEIEHRLACLVGWAVDRHFCPEPGEASWRIERTN